MVRCPRCNEPAQMGNDFTVQCFYCGYDGPVNQFSYTSNLGPQLPASYSKTDAELKREKKVFFAVVSIIIIVILAAALIWWASGGAGEADLDVSGFGYRYDFWSDTIHVWGYVVNYGDGWTSDFRSITVSITVYFDGSPYGHVAYIYDSLGPGERVFFDRTYSVPFTLDPDVSCYAKVIKVSWYND